VPPTRPALQLVTFSTMAVVLVLVLLLRGDATAGDLVAYITAAGMLPKPIRQLSEVSSTIQKRPGRRREHLFPAR
jgi:subfamily B ATP-binding cassette protein MsbA